MESPTIYLGQITLRKYEESDINAWQEWDTDPEVQEYLPEPINVTVSHLDQRAYLHDCLAARSDAYWSIVWTETKRSIGTISLNQIDQYHGVAELSIIVGDKRYWRRGVATEAIRAVVNYALNTIGLRRITAECETANIGIRRALFANNFLEEGRKHEARIKRGQPIDTVLYYRLRV